jgi:hypothetical protein
MNVFLMYPDRDLKPDQELPSNAAALIQDLELTTLFEGMAQGDRYLYEVANQVVLSSLDEPDTIRYRQEILQDCLRNPEVVRQIYQIPIQAVETKQKLWMGIFTRSPSGILSSARTMLEMYIGFLRILKQIADEHAGKFESAGFRRFLTMIQGELDDDYFAVIAGHLEALKFSKGVTLSAELGFGNEGTNYILRRPNPGKQNLIERITGPKASVYSFTLHPKDDHGANALADLMDRGLNLVANAVAQSSDHINSFFNRLRQELAFYIGCLNLSEQLTGLGGPITIPQPAPTSQDRLSFTGLYDIGLALTLKEMVVGNNLQADGKNLVLITGANQGGKSTFLRSIGLAQLMMQCGMFVPAEYYSANVCKRVFTHYKREEDSSMTRGKFDEELSRMSDIIDQITSHSMVLLNESFAGTNDREGSEIARQITSALLDKKIKVFFVTHLYELAHGYLEDKFDSAIFLRAERKASGERTFRIIEGEPMQTSFGMDVYQEIFDIENG